MKPRIAILTDLTDTSSAYSLTGIILDQARMLHDHNYPYDLLTLKVFNPKDKEATIKEGLRVRFELPQTKLHPYKAHEGPRPTTKDEIGFEDQVRIHFEGDPQKKTIGYKDILKDYDTIITHDLMFLEWFLPQNLAIRQCIELYPDKNWLHWVHSGPSNKPGNCVYPTTLRYSAAPKSTYVFLNDGQRLECALMFETTRDNIAVVQNTKDVRGYYQFSFETCKMIDKYDLFNHDLMQIYPFSTPRWEAKGIKQLLKLFGEWKKMGIRVKLVLINAHCNSPQDKPHLKSIEKYVEKVGLNLDVDVVMSYRFAEHMQSSTSDLERQYEWKKWLVSVPGRVIRDLNHIANIFVFPSKTECCSLIQAEAAISGKFFILNRDFKPMLEFASPKVLTYEFTANDPDNPKSDIYYQCVARESWAEMQTESTFLNRTLAVTRMYNRDWIFKNQFEPLLWKGFAGNLAQRVVKADEVITQDGKRIKPPSVQDVDTKTFPARQPYDLNTVPQEREEWEPDFSDPQPGMRCPIYGTCTQSRKEQCLMTANHCLMLDEIVNER